MFSMFCAFVIIGKIKAERIQGTYAVIDTVMFKQHEKPVYFLSTRVPGNIVVHPRRWKTPMICNWVPAVAEIYNRCKGGVDISTRFLKAQKLFRREIKWTQRYFMSVLGLSVFNCFLINQQQKILGKEVTWKSYTQSLAYHLCTHKLH